MHRSLFTAALLLLVGLWTVWFLAGTTSGARRWVPVALRRLLPARALHIGRIDGNLLAGLRLSQVSVGGLPGWWGQSRLVIDEAEVAALPQWLALRAWIRLRAVEWSQPPFAEHVSVQRIEVRWPFRLEHVQLIENARIRLPLSEPIVLSGAMRDERVGLSLYAKALDVREVIALLTRAPAWQSVTGTLNEVRLSVMGPWHELAWHGSFRATTLARYDFAVSECPGTLSLTMRGLPKTLESDGDIACQGGVVRSRQTVASLLPSRVAFRTQPTTASFDVHAISSIGGTSIRIALRGRSDRPDLRLTSTPPLPQGVLLAMLVTGKQWKGATDALTHGVISSDLALDFIDYFVLGGLGSTVAGRFGISGLSLRHNPETNRVGVETTLVDKVSVGVELDPSTITGTAQPAAAAGQTQPARTPIPYTVGAEYKVNDTTSVRLEGERTVLDHTTTATSSTADTEAALGPQTDDTVLLKFKKQF